MAESKYVFDGLLSGLASGILAGIITYIELPSPCEVVNMLADQYSGLGVDWNSIKPLISILLLLSPIIIVFFSLFLGAVFGALYELISRSMKLRDIVSAAITGLSFTLLLVGPNLLLGSSSDKILLNTIWGTGYTIVLLGLCILRSRGVIG